VYEQSFSRSAPGCIVFLIDRSDSMLQKWTSSGTTLAEGAARAINKILLELCVKATKENGGIMRDYFYVGCYGYGFCPSTGGEGVESALPAPFAPRGIVPLRELADRMTVREEPSVDEMSPPSRMPVWIEPYYGFRTPMCEAIAKVGQHIYEWSKAFPTSFPAIVCNVSDGMVTDSPYQGGDLAEWARRLTTIQTDDGPTLLLNVFLSPNRAPIVSFPSSADTLPEPRALLFSISSPLPDPMKENARSAQINVAEGARGLVFNADLATLVTFLEIGTRFEVHHG
jgi:hypothetical protein